MQVFLAIIQPFILIALGALLSRTRMFPRTLWEGVEKLVYYVLFPPLLFNSVARAELSLSQASLYLACGVGSMTIGIALSWIVSKLAPAGRLSDASVRQCGYRFNSYIGFAVVLALYGNAGLALFALLVGVWVPICNAAAGADLTAAAGGRGAGVAGIVKSIAKNPLILSTVAGLVFNVAGLAMPSLVTSVFKSLGAASLSLALMAIGSGLKLSAFRAEARLLALASVEKLAALPAVSFCIGLAAGLSPLELGALLAFTALPTANSCYILAVRMGGDGPLVANLTTLQTVCSLVTLPCWMWLVQAV